jgi:hypothetical protein
MRPQENALTRNRGCGDLVVFGPFFLLLLAALFVTVLVVFGG